MKLYARENTLLNPRPKFDSSKFLVENLFFTIKQWLVAFFSHSFNFLYTKCISEYIDRLLNSFFGRGRKFRFFDQKLNRGSWFNILRFCGENETFNFLDENCILPNFDQKLNFQFFWKLESLRTNVLIFFEQALIFVWWNAFVGVFGLKSELSIFWACFDLVPLRSYRQHQSSL